MTLLWFDLPDTLLSRCPFLVWMMPYLPPLPKQGKSPKTKTQSCTFLVGHEDNIEKIKSTSLGFFSAHLRDNL